LTKPGSALLYAWFDRPPLGERNGDNPPRHA
jgi:hypothetical protein